ncbi:hypothetical protein Q5752_001485 [Cryptotrichosporon argae]
MPKDDSALDAAAERESRAAAAAASASSVPLKRGDACLYCRKRRIKCDASKPTCAHCTKLGRACEYDSGKPVSRVKVLEDKVRELEGFIRARLGTGSVPPSSASAPASAGLAGISAASQRPSVAALVQDTFAAYNDTFNLDALPTQQQPPIDFSALASFNSLFAAPAPGIQFDPLGLPAPPADFDFATLDPSFMDLVNSFDTALAPPPARQSLPPPFSPPQPHPLQTPSSSGSFSHSQYQPQTLPSLSPPIAAHTMYTVNGPITVPAPREPSYSSPGSIPTVATPDMYQAFVQDASMADVPAGNDGLPVDSMIDHQHKQNASPKLPSYGWLPDADMPEQTLVGGWFDAHDLPKAARDHLLDLFFIGMKSFGHDMHVPRFYAALTKPMSQRPHPCLLYAMYLLATRISSSPPIRALEGRFCEIAEQRLQESIKNGDRLLDACRAASMLAVYKYSLAKYHEGWMMTGTAARLVISCGLHQIPSSVWRPPMPGGGRDSLVGILRHRTWVLGPPADAIELGERIAAFWAVFLPDRCGAISTQWPCALPDESIITPYPKPLYEYELGLVSALDDDYSISSLFDGTHVPCLPPGLDSTAAILRLRALAILDRASKLMYLKPEPAASSTPSPPPSADASTHRAQRSPDDINIDEYLYFQNYTADQASPNAAEAAAATHAHAESSRSARVRTPHAYAQVHSALVRFEDDLPPERRTDWAAWDGRAQAWQAGADAGKSDVYAVHFVIGCAWMFLFDIWAFNAPNTQAVNVARRLAFAARLVVNNPNPVSTPLDVFVSMCWTFIVKILIREAKRLQALGDAAAAGPIEAEIEVVVQALRQFGKRYQIATVQAHRMDEYRQRSADDMSRLDTTEWGQHVQKQPTLQLDDDGAGPAAAGPAHTIKGLPGSELVQSITGEWEVSEGRHGGFPEHPEIDTFGYTT